MFGPEEGVASREGLRAEHVYAPAYVHGERLPHVRELFSLKVSQSGSGVSFRGTDPHAAFFSSAPLGLDRHYCRAQRSVRWLILHSISNRSQFQRSRSMLGPVEQKPRP